MFRNFTILILVLIFAAFNTKAQKKGDKSADETAIRANVEQLVKGWNSKSGEEFAKPFAEDADYVVINGMQIKGRMAIAKGHEGIFETIYKNTNLALSVQQIRFLKSDVAVVHVFGTATTPQGDSSRTTNARMTLVMTKNAGKWEIVAFQNTEVEGSEKE